jgi:DNA-binding GntR family transcriptional regulator
MAPERHVEGLGPVPREPTSQIIARRLRGAIADGVLAPGAQLGETDLAARFEVSRGPLREAMQRLVQEGLLRSERHRGLFVAELSTEDVHDIYRARMAVESAAVSIQVRDGTPFALAELEAAQRDLREACHGTDTAEVSRADLRFHEVLVSSSGSARLARMMDTLLAETRMCLSALAAAYSSGMPSYDRVDEHAAILDAIAARDRIAAHGALARHMQEALQRLAPGRELWQEL